MAEGFGRRLMVYNLRCKIKGPGFKVKDLKFGIEVLGFMVKAID